MRTLVIKVGSWIILRLLALRYRIEVKGLDKLPRQGGILFLPNHPAEIDPIIVYTLLAARFRPRPLVIEHFFYLKGARLFMDIIRALPMPNFELSANSWKIHQVEKSLKRVKEEVKKGENFLIYPSGHLKREPFEIIGGNSFIHRVLEEAPEVQIVLVRTTGLWGSAFSCALTGNSPDFWRVLATGFKTILKNGIFFTPRRKVTIEFDVPKDFPRDANRLDRNRYLEKWYNQYPTDTGTLVDQEPFRLISYSCFSKQFPEIRRTEKKEAEKKKLTVAEEERQELYAELTKLSGIKDIKEEMDLSRDLGLDSLDLAGIHAFLFQRFHVEAVHPADVATVYDLLALLGEGNIEESEMDPTAQKKYVWPDESDRPELLNPEGKTIPECLLSVCDRMGNKAACGDEISNYMSYRRLKLGVLILAEQFKKFPEKYVGVLLPSASVCYLIVLALMFAGKTPVMLNWTAGERSLNYARDLLKIKRIFSSRRFLERVATLELGELEESLVLMEDFKHTISLWDKLKGMLLVRRKKRALIRSFNLEKIDENDPAVMLFTSGTENYPKAVPLSHKNILSNHKGVLEVAQINKNDILYGVLPPFHSFGFSLTGLLPLLVGLRVFYAPDPTDSHAMARDCLYRQITILCCAPSFYRNLFRIATPRQLNTVRLFVAGAEKAGPELFEHVKRLGGNKEMIEGYGITECSPVVTICRQGKPPKGVGEPLPGVELCVIHHETGERIPDHQDGEICIAGPNVFNGYLGEEAKSPFIEIDGKQWYRSGDLGHVDADRSLILSGRLKRFVKIGGEMVSLVAIEEELTRYARKKKLIKPEAEAPQLAVGAIEGERPVLILLTTFDFSKEEANSILNEKGFPRLVKIAEVYKIDEIPLTGTGKLQLRRIKELINEKYTKNS